MFSLHQWFMRSIVSADRSNPYIATISLAARMLGTVRVDHVTFSFCCLLV